MNLKRETKLNDTFYHRLFEGVIRYVSIETSARNQTCVVLQCLPCDTALTLWSTNDVCLLERSRFIELKKKPFLCCCQLLEAMGHSCSYFALDGGTYHSDNPLCRGRDIFSGCQEALQSFLCQSYFLECALHRLQVHMQYDVRVYERRA